MSGIGAIQALSPAETWEAWQALMQASLGEAEGTGAVAAGQPHLQPQPTEAAQPLSALNLPGEASPLLQAPHAHHAHQVQRAHEPQPATASVAQALAAPDVPTVAVMPTAQASLDKPAASSPLQAPSPGLLGDTPMAATRLADAGATVLPMAPVLMTPLALQNGPELRWRAQDAASWRQLFDDAGRDAPDEEEAPPLPLPEAAEPEAMPPWALLLLARLREATLAPAAAAALRPALQAWRLGLPVLLASPAGLASLQASRDATTWQWRRWPARWRTARPATIERWWTVRLALGPQGRPRTLRDLAGGAVPAPGQVSCELRLDDVAPGIAQWTEVLVQAPASASLRALLAARPSIPWLLCNQALWPRETP
ncbi:hypothetical protein [Roseateles sp. P5_D6]